MKTQRQTLSKSTAISHLPQLLGVTRFLRKLDHAAGSSTGDRQHLTVLSCDLMDSTIAAQLDAEEWRQIVTTYHRVVQRRKQSSVSAAMSPIISATALWPILWCPEAHGSLAGVRNRSPNADLTPFSALGGA